VPPLRRIGPRGVNRMSSRRRVATMVIDLANFIADRLKQVRIGDRRQRLRSPAADTLIIAIGDRQKETRFAIGRGAEDETFFRYPHSPSVVGGGSQELNLFDLWRIGLGEFETKEPHPERLLGHSVNLRGRVVITL